ncbi:MULTISPECIES: hypothetical protein [unclassified Rhizobium]|uniref:hypothetical protein n=1 Tax=unclassified Rhizobium TaxID=2613769 RepID=UPI00160C1D64|nr:MULTISPECIES: hypothetical protein [unclassified Rhizobium]MBB3319351.1 hypothetical protein [Rhizobium sp. BK181]MBB3542906.1 hypothetical protein [Rhizobium sp. BK399]MCS3742807.1 hypothetical protein [Rhizobium sp. BK661]MCS4095021.1 hypothetical protein [Rhizobium sp. BK176]
MIAVSPNASLKRKTGVPDSNRFLVGGASIDDKDFLELYQLRNHFPGDAVRDRGGSGNILEAVDNDHWQSHR